MNVVTLQPITIENWKECASLDVAPDQIEFLPSNLYSIAESQFYPESCPLAFYNAHNQMIGFALYGKDFNTGLWKIFRFMIDKRFQGQGNGRAGLHLLMQHILSLPEATDVLVSYQTHNLVAKTLYENYGFVQEVVEGTKATARFVQKQKNSYMDTVL